MLTKDGHIRMIARFASRFGYPRDTSLQRRTIDATCLPSRLLHLTEVGQESDLGLMCKPSGTSYTEDSQSSSSGDFLIVATVVSILVAGRSSGNWDPGLSTTLSPDSNAFRLAWDVPAASTGIGVLDRIGTIH